MIELPAALAPWAADLAIFPTELALTLAPWVGRLALAVGPLSDLRSTTSVEPDGYLGLSHRGSYERLLVSEWGIADLFPEEFLRRAAAGEHLFLDLARRGPHGAKRSIALISAGPAQLGAPRLAHLAALVVLARRAAAAGASFAWGILEDPARILHDGLDAASVRTLLDARTVAPVDDAVLVAWHEHLGLEPDWWWIGATGGARRATELGASTLAISDVLEPGVHALDVSLDRRGRTARVRLALPAADLCARLLRDPFRTGAGARTAASGRAHALRFASGRKLLVDLEGGEIECWPIPNSPREPLGNKRSYRHSGRFLVAIGVGRRAILAVTVDPANPTTLEVSYGGHPIAATVTLPDRARDDLAMHAATGRIGSCALARVGSRAPALVIELPPGHLVVLDAFELTPASAKPVAALMMSTGAPVLAASITPHLVQWAELEQGTVHVRKATASGSPIVARVATRVDEPGVHFGYAPFTREPWGLVAIQHEDNAWTLCAPDGADEVLESPLHVVGAARWQERRALLTRNDMRLAWVHAGGRELLPPARAPIVTVAICTERPELAWVTLDGEVIVRPIVEEGVLMRLEPTRARR